MQSKITPLNAPFIFSQSRGGDSISQGGLTSATTAIGNGQSDGVSNENRSGRSRPGDNRDNSMERGAGVFSGNQSHNSLSKSDRELRERTPTKQDRDSRLRSHS